MVAAKKNHYSNWEVTSVMRKYLLTAIVAACGALMSTSQANAGPLLAAGGSSVAITAELAPTSAILADTGLTPYAFGAGNTGFVREVVYAPYAGNALGGNTYAYQVQVTGGDIAAISGFSYASVGAVNVGFVLPGTESAPFVLGGAAGQTPIGASRTGGTGATVTFSFANAIVPDGGPPGNASVELLIQTASLTPPGAGLIGLIDGGGGSSPGFGPVPVPEPTSMALIGCGLASMLGYGWKRRKVTA